MKRVLDDVKRTDLAASGKMRPVLGAVEGMYIKEM